MSYWKERWWLSGFRIAIFLALIGLILRVIDLTR